MIHLAAEAQQFGCLDNCSSFNFEIYLQQIKRIVRSGRNPRAQIVKRLSECSLSDSVECKNTVVSVKAPNNAYILDASLACVVLNGCTEAVGEDASELFVSIVCKNATTV
jgi:hypothetical protein